jgi:hypothetical protein
MLFNTSILHQLDLEKQKTIWDSYNSKGFAEP